MFTLACFGVGEARAMAMFGLSINKSSNSWDGARVLN
jgi:hypothetical protein